MVEVPLNTTVADPARDGGRSSSGSRRVSGSGGGLHPNSLYGTLPLSRKMGQHFRPFPTAHAYAPSAARRTTGPPDFSGQNPGGPNFATHDAAGPSASQPAMGPNINYVGFEGHALPIPNGGPTYRLCLLDHQLK
ncbi:hypothetical protein GOBAR_AA21179 [Gossypium barbadense]|uniref:Uncharacterized protein n=1 Tax=Gossypium barbadense TaxID=3634 RepID=A0A2P5X823_GOSBA|nr:hypothetical protein GOBAR_AA21179 [Gossypium barbadense]